MDDFVGALILEPGELVQQIEAYGFSMFVGEDGVVHGRSVVPGKKIPWEMRPLLDQVQLQNEAVADFIRSRQREIVDLNGITQEEAEPWLARVRTGEYRLVPGTRVTYEKSTRLTYMKLERVRHDGGAEK